MAKVLHTHPCRATVDDLVAALQEIETGPAAANDVLQCLSEVRLGMEALAPYLFWSDDFYTRNLIFRDEVFEVLALCWRPGQRTPIHAHDEQCGWMQVLQGGILENRYRRCSLPALATGTDGALSTQNHVELEHVGIASYVDNGRVSTVDRVNAVHQMTNVERSPWGTVSLHVYSRPIVSCVVFDPELYHCHKRVLSYYSEQGTLVSIGGTQVLPVSSDQVETQRGDERSGSSRTNAGAMQGIDPTNRLQCGSVGRDNRAGHRR